jgi:hypothetical protein
MTRNVKELPAFPETENVINGMTLRDWFAGQALSGIIGLRLYVTEEEEELAQHVYEIADAMLKERDK